MILCSLAISEGDNQLIMIISSLKAPSETLLSPEDHNFQVQLLNPQQQRPFQALQVALPCECKNALVSLVARENHPESHMNHREDMGTYGNLWEHPALTSPHLITQHQLQQQVPVDMSTPLILNVASICQACECCCNHTYGFTPIGTNMLIIPQFSNHLSPWWVVIRHFASYNQQSILNPAINHNYSAGWSMLIITDVSWSNPCCSSTIANQCWGPAGQEKTQTLRCPVSTGSWWCFMCPDH